MQISEEKESSNGNLVTLLSVDANALKHSGYLVEDSNKQTLLNIVCFDCTPEGLKMSKWRTDP